MFCVFGKFFAGLFYCYCYSQKNNTVWKFCHPPLLWIGKLTCLESSLLLCQVQPVSAAQYHHPSPPSPFPSSSIIVPILYHYCATIFSLKTWNNLCRPEHSMVEMIVRKSMQKVWKIWTKAASIKLGTYYKQLDPPTLPQQYDCCVQVYLGDWVSFYVLLDHPSNPKDF